MEKWEYIEGFDDCYEISTEGRVRSWYGWNGREYYRRIEPLIMQQFVSDRFDKHVKKETKRKRLKKRKRLDYHKPHVVYIYTETDLSIKDMAKILPLGRDRITEILKEEGLL